MVDEPCHGLILHIGEVLLMSWIEEVNVAMKLLKDACKRNEMWSECGKCPFDAYCTVLEVHEMGTPDEWKIED